jgi:hypothetical protein
MKKIILYGWVLIVCGLLQAQKNEEPFKINSGEVSYDGKQIILVGKVDVQHDLGSIIACRLAIRPQLEKKLKFGFLEISQNVQLVLKNGSHLNCQRAEIDYAKLSGHCWGNEEQPQVSYHLPLLLEMTSDEVQIDLMREEAPSSKTTLKQIQALNHVNLQYKKEYFLKAQRALYEPAPKSSLTLFADASSTCQLLHANDLIEAQQMAIDMNNQQMRLTEPQGTLKPSSTQSLTFGAHEMTWDQQKHLLHLMGDVSIVENKNTRLFTPHEVYLTQTLKEGKNVIATLHSSKETLITCQKNEALYQLNCPGELVLDYEHSRLTMQSSPDVLKQVYLEGTLGEVYADQVVIDYQWKNQQLNPKKIILNGNIKLLNRFDGHVQESGGSVLHYALADHMEYLPDAQEVILSAKQGQRVLFYDKINNVQMSAPSLKIHQDQTTQKQVIQGVGDVRFTFIEKELEQLKKQFETHQSLSQDKKL